jgi:transmembrane sensor
MTEPEFKALLERYLSGQASAAEQRLMDQFFDSYRDQHAVLEGMSEPVKDEILRKIRQRTDLDIEIVPARRSYAWLAAAASVTLLAVAGYFFFYGTSPSATGTRVALKTVTQTTTRGQKITVTLPDGTQVRLNANSVLSYPERFAGATREVTLEGEGFFDVAHDAAHPFIVHAGDAATRVLGTSFNVLAATAAVTVTLVEGSVNISTKGVAKDLKPNEQAVIDAGSAEIRTHQVDVSKYIGWKNNTLIFDHITVQEAFSQMENWYNVDLQMTNPALGKCFVTARYENESLENVLNSFRFMLNVEFSIDGHHVRVDGKGCR